jgi:DNA-binding NtrC family response regulator
MVSSREPLAVVVVQGTDVGARLPVDAQVRIVGRARGADLALTDLGVSRKHLEITVAGTGVLVRVCEGAAPFIWQGRETERAELPSGESVVIGNTVLRVVGAASEMPTPHSQEVTSAKTLLGGLASDVRGLAAVYDLAEALDRAVEPAAAESLLVDWARRHLGALSAELLDAEEARARPELARAVAEAPAFIGGPAPDGKGIVLVAVTDGAEPTAVVLRLPEQPRPGDDVRRLVIVAARVCASSLARLRRIQSVEGDNALLRRLAVGGARSFLGSSPEATRIASLVPRLAASDAVVLLLGESGTGKTFLARLIHEASTRADEPLRILNCASIPEGLVEAELFGHERGAFTGAVNARAGAFEAARRGTILLDEVAELAPTSQAKLLRVLEDRHFERIGSNRPLPVECRVLAATNRDLRQMVERGAFRADLFFRLSVVNVQIPPLADRGDDILELAQQILADLVPTAGRRIEGFSDDALSVIRRYGWPGNVRELRNAIEHALVLGEGPRIRRIDLPETVVGEPRSSGSEGTTVTLPANLEWLEARAIEAALKATSGNRTRAAALLGINRVTLYKKLREE